MTVRKQITGHPIRFGGEKHSGWLPIGAAVPEPTPTDDVILTLQISESDSGFILEWWDEAKRHVGDTWHQSEEDAMDQAKTWFGVEPDHWKDQNPQQSLGGDSENRTEDGTVPGAPQGWRSRREMMKHLCALLCIAALTSCASEPEARLQQPREMAPQDAKLLLSSLNGNTNEMHSALQSGADINTRQWGLCSAMFMTDATPLYASVVSKKPEAVRFLLDHGADASIPNHSGETPLDLATRLKLDTIEKMLKEKTSNKTPEHIP